MLRRLSLLAATLLLACVLPARAQTGCADSPESPTLVLALVAGIGVVAAGMRAARRRKSQ